MVKIQKFNEINVNDLVFSSPKTSDKGITTVYINNPSSTSPTDRKVVITCPKSFLKFGISKYDNSHSLQINLENDSEFMNFLHKLDLKTFEMATNNSMSWFKKQINPDLLKRMYNPCIKHNNTNYPPVFRMKLPVYDGKFNGDIFEAKTRQELDMNAIQPNVNVECIIELKGIYFRQNDFGISWVIRQVKVHPSEKLTGYCFEDTDDDSDAEPN